MRLISAGQKKKKFEFKRCAGDEEDTLVGCSQESNWSYKRRLRLRANPIARFRLRRRPFGEAENQSLATRLAIRSAVVVAAVMILMDHVGGR